MRVFVTGGAGFIGSNLVTALLSAGHDVAVIDDLSTGKTENLDDRASFLTLDILDPAVPDHLASFSPDVVVHLAAQASVAASVRDPENDWRINAEGTRLIAAASRAAGVSKVISASSAAVYGEPAELPLKETSPKQPINPYGRSKLQAEGLLAEALADSGVDHASFRFSNVYGPRQDAQGEGGVVAIFLDRIHAGQAPILFGDGGQTRDFIFVGDIVGAIMAAMAWEGRLDEAGPAFNISTGSRTSVDELIAAIRKATGYDGPVEHDECREGDIRHSVLAPSRARSSFKWEAQAGLEDGIAATWRWFASQT